MKTRRRKLETEKKGKDNNKKKKETKAGWRNRENE